MTLRGKSTSLGQKTKRPRGDRQSQAVVDARLALAERLIAEGTPRPDFLVEFGRVYPGIDKRTIDRYKALAYKSIRVRREAERAHDVETRLHRLTYLSHKLEKIGEYTSMMNAEKLLAQITGVLEAEKHLHIHAPQPGTQGVVILPVEEILALPAYDPPERVQEAQGAAIDTELVE